MADGPPRRQWVTEEAVLGELERLADLSMSTAREYHVATEERATKEAEHKRLRARRMLKAMSPGADGKRASAALAEVTAEADDEVATALHERLVADALADSLRQTLMSIRTNQEALRTAAASARDGVVGPGMSGRR